MYGVISKIFGDEDAGFTSSRELIAGSNYYWYDSRNLRTNVQLMKVDALAGRQCVWFLCRGPARPHRVGGDVLLLLGAGVLRHATSTLATAFLAVALTLGGPARRLESQAIAASPPPAEEFHDSHFHLTNYVQQGIDVRQFLHIMGTRVGRSTLFGIPLQQQWSYANSGDFAPTYYLQSDAPLYYYSFTDAHIASVYRSLSKDDQSRFDPMITGFNPADMYAVDHIRRVLNMFPGVFTGIGEFTIHKEFVSSKIAGETASLTNPALDRILEFAGDAGLVVLLHNDIDVPFAKQDTEPAYLAQMKRLLVRHPNTSIIWAHMGLGRVVHPVQTSAGTAWRAPTHVGIVETMLARSRALPREFRPVLG